MHLASRFTGPAAASLAFASFAAARRAMARAAARLVRAAGAAALAGALLQSQAFDAERMGVAAQRIGPQAVSGARALQAVLAASAALDDPGKLAEVNQFFNRRIGFRDDAEVWGRTDYWASPLETLDKGAGDCEDFAIAKYFTLLAAGIPAQRLRLVYVRAAIGGPGGPAQAHMVLAYYATADAEPLILDNLIGDIRTARSRPDLVPVFSFNSEGLWQGVGALAAGDPTARLSRWREVLGKARAEGFQ